MSFFKKKQEIRAEPLTLIDLIQGDNTVSKAVVLQIPTVSACISKIAETVSRLPVKLYRRNADEVEEITSDNRLVLLNNDTGDTLNPVDMWKSAIEDYFLGNGAWIYVNSDGLKVKSLHYVDCNNISVMQNTDPIFKAFHVTVNGVKYYDFQFIRLFRKTRDGFSNIPLQAESPAIFSAAYNAVLLEKNVNLTGGHKTGFFLIFQKSIDFSEKLCYY